MRHIAQEHGDIQRFVQWANEHDTVRAMIMTSTRAVPTAQVDILSDYDLILVVADVRPFVDDRTWLEDFGPVLALYRDPILLDDGLETSGNVTQYEDGLKIDFTFWPLELMRRIVAETRLPDELDAGYRILLDKDGLTEGLKPPTYKAYIPTPPTEVIYLDTIEMFFLDTGYVAKFLWRDDLIAAKHILDNMLKQEHLRPMLEWHAEVDHNWSLKPGPYGRGIKRWLRPDLWAELESTYTGLQPEANWDALFRTIMLFRRVAIEVGKHLGYAYPYDLDRRALAYLEKVKNLDREAATFP